MDFFWVGGGGGEIWWRPHWYTFFEGIAWTANFPCGRWHSQFPTPRCRYCILICHICRTPQVGGVYFLNKTIQATLLPSKLLHLANWDHKNEWEKKAKVLLGLSHGGWIKKKHIAKSHPNSNIHISKCKWNVNWLFQLDFSPAISTVCPSLRVLCRWFPLLPPPVPESHQPTSNGCEGDGELKGLESALNLV